MEIIIEEWIRECNNLHKQCEKIRGKRISDRAWFNWERLAGAAYNQGQKKRCRRYTLEQSKMLLCLAWWRRCQPGVHVTYKNLREYCQSNDFKFEEVFDAIANNPTPAPPKPEVEVVAIAKVKSCCDAIFNRTISRESWSRWKQHIGIPKHERFVEAGKAAVLVAMACWRHDNPTTPFPSERRLLFLVEENRRRGMDVESSSSGKRQHQWEMEGCYGEDLDKYLTSQGYQIKKRTLYAWGKNTKMKFKLRQFYSPSELQKWKQLAQQKKYATQSKPNNSATGVV